MSMSRRRMMALSAAGLAGLPHLGSGAAEAFPSASKTVTILVGFAPGGGGDTWSRWMADYLRARWKTTVVVENKPGAGGTIVAGLLARAKPDGYTVALATSSPFTVAPYLQKLPYDPVADFRYLFQYLVSAQPLFVKADAQWTSMQELMAWGKANPGKLFWSTAATNGATHISTAAAFQAAGIDATYVPYKGGADAMSALLGGQIQALVAAEFPPFAASGRVRLLAESGPDKIPGYPDVPTYKELQFPVSVPIFYGIAGPAGMPEDAVKAWEAAGRDMVAEASFREMLGKLSGTGAYMDATAFGRTIADVNRKMAKLVPGLKLGN
ncbi:tripartite tricarboxylate transporter substrate binding protein [Variovorax sp. KK3]|uniref:Bug family tripartite tricarboxylate transporter substrate binding protein n=1 Tax=Variovorax sp. KK3 TaxID=1855728 RepID=UPI0015C2CC4F|nr:tripartite tricarboxylate transporter substrate binding protein [Variovorax sp. KK3]